jgi:phosphomevalonate kinase
VAELGRARPEEHRRWLEAQAQGARDAAASLGQADASAFVAALRRQLTALDGLGRAASVPIVTPELAELAPQAEAEGGVLLPAGAGGGDLALFVGEKPSSAALRRALADESHQLLKAELSARGASRA